MSPRPRSTNPSHYYARKPEPQPEVMQWSEPSHIERHGEMYAMILGATVFGFALGIMIVGLVIA